MCLVFRKVVRLLNLAVSSLTKEENAGRLRLHIKRRWSLGIEKLFIFGMRYVSGPISLETVVDCAEGTTRQFALQPGRLKPNLKIQNVSKVFITHMHVDHVMGLIGFLRGVLLPPPSPFDLQGYSTNSQRTVDVYGPAGLRTFVRQNLKVTRTRTNYTYAVHELLTPHDSSTPCINAPRDHPSRMDPRQTDVMHYSEERGGDLRAGDDGLWRGIASGHGRRRECVIWVDAGPIKHRDPCIGYVFTEDAAPARKLVILGDTFDPSAILPLCTDASLLIHEATDSHISLEADPSGKLAKRTKEQVREKALGKGHSVPEMAGEFAKKIGASALVLNHIGSRFPSPRNPNDITRARIIRDIEVNAENTWESGKICKVAYDFFKIDVPIPSPIPASLPAVYNANPDPNTVTNPNPNTHSLPIPNTHDDLEVGVPAPPPIPSSHAKNSNLNTYAYAPPPEGIQVPDWDLTPNPYLGPPSASTSGSGGNGRKRARSEELGDERGERLPNGPKDDNRNWDGSAHGSRPGSRHRKRPGRGRGRVRGSDQMNAGHMNAGHSYERSNVPRGTRGGFIQGPQPHAGHRGRGGRGNRGHGRGGRGQPLDLI